MCLCLCIFLLLSACIFAGKLKANKGWGALHLASYFGHTAVVKFLIEVCSSACNALCHFEMFSNVGTKL